MRPAASNSVFSASSIQPMESMTEQWLAQLRSPKASAPRDFLFSRLVVQPPDRDWRPEVVDTLQTLIRLPIGWDGYSGKPVDLSTADFTLRMLESVCPSGVPAPSIVPGIEGDVQVEWHTERGDIELHVIRPNNVHAWRQNDSIGDDGEEVELTVDFRPILLWIKEISEPTIDAESSAA